MSKLTIHNWDKWQSYRQDRGQPPWIKIHRECMRHIGWVTLTDAQRGQLVAIWLLAADHNGVIPSSPLVIKKLCHLDTEPDLNLFIEHGFIDAPQDGVTLASQERQVDPPEKRREETEKRQKKPCATSVAGFDEFWIQYPKKIGKEAARKAWNKAKPKIEFVLAALEWQKSCEQWLKDGGQFVPNPATYLNQGRWMDEPQEVGLSSGGKPWFLSWPGIEDKARSLGIEKQNRESDSEFRDRIYKESGLTPEEYKKEKRRHEAGG